MGLQIGDSIRGFSGAPASARQQPRPVPGAEPPAPVRQPAQDSLEVGFGDNTVSVPTVALRTVDRNFENAQRAARTLEEVRAEFRERRLEQEQRAAQREASNVATGFEQERPGVPESPAAEPVSFRPAPAPEVRFFTSQADTPANPATQPSGFTPQTDASARLDLLI